MNDLRSRTISGLAWSGLAQVANQALVFVVGVVLARILTPAEFGLLAMSMIVIRFANVISGLGLGDALIQRQDLESRHYSTVFWANVGVSIVLAALVTAAAPLIAAFFDVQQLKLMTAVVSLVLVFGAMGIVPRALLRKRMAFRALMIVETVSVVVAGGVGITLALTGFGVWSLVVLVVLTAALTSAALWLTSSWRPALRFDLGDLSGLTHFGVNLVGFNLVNFWSRNVDTLLIGRVVGAFDLGVYSRAYNLMHLSLTQIATATSTVMFPALSEIQADHEAIRRVYLRAIRSISLLTFPIMLGLVVTARPFILSVYGPKWEPVIPVLQLFCLSGVMESIGATAGWLFTSQGRTDLMFKWGMYIAVVRTVSAAIGLQWGMMGVAVAYTVSSYVFLWYPGWSIPARLVGLRFLDMFKYILSPLACALGMAALVAATSAVIGDSLPHWATLLILITVGVACQYLLMRLFRIAGYKDLVDVVRAEWERIRSGRDRSEGKKA
jgi:PST family polysaccharide transporter